MKITQNGRITIEPNGQVYVTGFAYETDPHINYGGEIQETAARVTILYAMQVLQNELKVIETQDSSNQCLSDGQYTLKFL